MSDLRPGVRFLHARILDPDWKPGPGERYADAPPAVCRITAVRQGRVYYAVDSETHARRYFQQTHADESVRKILTTETPKEGAR